MSAPACRASLWLEGGETLEGVGGGGGFSLTRIHFPVFFHGQFPLVRGECPSSVKPSWILTGPKDAALTQGHLVTLPGGLFL